MAKYTAELGLDTESRFLCSVTGRSSGETMNCPAGSAACLIHEGHAYDVGRPQDQLKRHDKDRWLIYLMILLWASQSSGWDKALTSLRLLLPLIQVQFWGIGRDYFFKCWEDSFFFLLTFHYTVIIEQISFFLLRLLFTKLHCSEKPRETSVLSLQAEEWF